MELTVGITAHDEGLLAHKTMLSIFEALKQLDDVKYEIIINIDNGTKETKRYFSRYDSYQEIKVHHNTFSDLGASRNYIVKKAKGKYVFFLDADDLISRNYFQAMLRVLHQEKGDIVVHPACCLCFWEDYSDYCLMWNGQPVTSRLDSAKLLFSRNRWPSSCAAAHELFRKNPYIRTTNGFGHEDYAFNIRLASFGAKHLIADQTTLFYRQKESSLMRDNNAKAVTQPYTPLFDFREWQQYSADQFTVHDSQSATSLTPKQRLLNLYVKARNRKALNTIITPFAKVARRLTKQKLIRHHHPQWLMDTWKDAAKIELQLYPTPWLLDHVDQVSPQAELPTSAAYYQLCQSIPDYPDYIFIVPWLVAGGADKVVLNYLQALQEIHPDWKIAVITTLDAYNTWRDKLPSNAYLIDFGKVAAPLREEARDLLFTRLIIQLKAKKLHIINSRYGYQWADHHSELIKAHYQLNISLFCHDIVPDTAGQGYFDYADPYALRIYPIIHKIYTDNAAVVNRLVDKYAFNKDKIKVHYQPVELPKNAKTDRKPISSTPLKLLWASRISAQKNPDLLIRIAKKLDPAKAHIDMYGRRCPDCAHLNLQVGAMSYHGEFNGLQSLSLDSYDLLLYTSHIDGIPNIILESAGAGLPMLASAVGGVPDFITHRKTGFLVEDTDNEDAYLDLINEIYDQKPNLSDISKQALQLAQERHSFTSFVDAIREDF